MRLNDIIKIGDTIKKYRKALNISQRELGRRVGISGQMVSKIENNLSQPSIETFNKIATALGVTVNDLIKNNTIDITNMNDDEKLSSKTIPELFEEMCDIMCNELCKYADTVDSEAMCEPGRTGGCPLRKYF